MIRLYAAASIAALALAACSQPAEPPAAAEPSEAGTAPATPAATPAGAPASSGALTAEGWGPLRIGMSRAEVEQALGPDANPGSVGGPDPESCDQFRPQRAPEDMLVMIESGVLTSIWTSEGSSLKTDKGFGVGDTAAAVKAGYGPELLASPHKYEAAPAEYLTVWSRGGGADYVQDANARGVSYHVGGDGRVDHVAVGGPSIQYVEGCA